MTALEAGEKAPQFTGKDQDGNTISLEDFKGSKLALFFYPKDDTPGCTKEACNLRDNYEDLLSAGIKILGVSPDSEKRHKKFIEKYNLPFPLLVDEDKEVLNKYGVWGPKKFMGKSYTGVHRTTFIINEKGNIESVIKKVKTKDHAQQIFEAIGMD